MDLFAGFLSEIFMLVTYAAVFAGVFKLFQAVTLLTEIRDQLSKSRNSGDHYLPAAPEAGGRRHLASASPGHNALPDDGEGLPSGLHEKPAPAAISSEERAPRVDPNLIDTSDADTYAESLLRSLQQRNS